MRVDNLIRDLYVKAPMSLAKKIRFKQFLFKHLGFALKNMDAYRRWLDFNGKLAPRERAKMDECIGLPIWTPSKADLLSVVESIHGVAKKIKGYDLEFVPRQPLEWKAPSVPLKLIAYYLPQFHPIRENDQWWGKGFTEWTNVSKAAPQFVGHYQPHLPGELGFYDLRLPEVMAQQIDLAKQYGIHGFCFHHYWFGGKRLLERPIDNFLKDRSLDINFCLCWANENWTRRWDGSENELLMAQAHSAEDDIAFIEDLFPAFSDPRYIKIDGRPLLIVYRVSLLPDAKATVDRWKMRCRKAGLPEPYLVAARSFEVTEPFSYGFDATVEFPPHQVAVSEITRKEKVLSKDYCGKIYDYREFAAAATASMTDEAFPNFKAVMPSWDNEARKPGAGHTFAYSSPAAYSKWLRQVCQLTDKRARSDHKLVFINAWNEWAEGAHLEPDRKNGYAYLHATAGVLSEFVQDPELNNFVGSLNTKFKKGSDAALILHLYYEDMFEDLHSTYFKNVQDFDVFLSVRRGVSLPRLMEICKRLGNVYIDVPFNTGRDIKPLLGFLPKLVNEGYASALKLHTKRSMHMENGDAWRCELFDSLLKDREVVSNAISALRSDKAISVIAPDGALMNLSERNTHILNERWLNDLLTRLGRADLIGKYDIVFPAGSMYWFNPVVMLPLLAIGVSMEDFEPELGQIDGTLAHAIERLIGLCATMTCSRIVEIKDVNNEC